MGSSLALPVPVRFRTKLHPRGRLKFLDRDNAERSEHENQARGERLERRAPALLVGLSTEAPPARRGSSIGPHHQIGDALSALTGVEAMIDVRVMDIRLYADQSHPGTATWTSRCGWRWWWRTKMVCPAWTRHRVFPVFGGSATCPPCHRRVALGSPHMSHPTTATCRRAMNLRTKWYAARNYIASIGTAGDRVRCGRLILIPSGDDIPPRGCRRLHPQDARRRFGCASRYVRECE
jgi:hypothetical protein